MMLAADGPNSAALPGSRPGWGTPASLGVHALLLAALLLIPQTKEPEPPPVRSIAVEIISEAQFDALNAPPTPSPVSPVRESLTPRVEAAAPEVESDAAPPASDAGPIRATEFFAGKLLAEPASAGLRRAMRGIENRERLVQLCDIEAMEQIRRARPDFDPDIVVAYAFAETEIRDGALLADGAAFRSRREWYEIHFTCTAAADLSAVRDFEFSVGDFIPHEEWEAHYLTAEEAED